MNERRRKVAAGCSSSRSRERCDCSRRGRLGAGLPMLANPAIGCRQQVQNTHALGARGRRVTNTVRTEGRASDIWNHSQDRLLESPKPVSLLTSFPFSFQRELGKNFTKSSHQPGWGVLISDALPLLSQGEALSLWKQTCTCLPSTLCGKYNVTYLDMYF